MAETVFARPLALADVTTHYCPGCTHGLIHRLVAEVLDELGVKERTVGVAPVGCAVLAYNYFNCDFQEAAHGRAPAVATGVKRARPDLIVFSYQGDGDLASIGMAEIVHCANRGEKVTVVFVNNAIYGMTGGQMAPTTMPGTGGDHLPARTRRRLNRPPHPGGGDDLHPAHAGLRGTGHRPQSPGRGPRQGDAAPRLHLPGRGQVFLAGRDPLDLSHQLGPPAGRGDRVVGEEHAALLPGRRVQDARQRQPRTETVDDVSGGGMQSEVIMAGFGGQGILLIGKMLAYAGMHEGKEVSWLPSYGPEMRGGTCNCTVVVSDKPVGSPVIRSPRAVLAMNLPSLEKFEPDIRPGGLLLINSSLINRGSDRKDLTVIEVPANQIATELGNPRGANMVALGAYLGATDAVSVDEVIAVIRETFAAKPAVIDVNIEALRKGYELGAAHKVMEA